MKKGTIVLVRHGESRMNELNRFTGWIDIPLSKKGIDEAHMVADHCAQFDYDVAFTSDLERAHETLLIILSHQRRIGLFQHGGDQRYLRMEDAPRSFFRKTIPIFTTEKLNEREYGTLQGLNKNSAVKEYGKKQIVQWRRGFSDRPPKGESLKDVYTRVQPYYKKNIEGRLKKREKVLVVAHGNTLRTLIKYMENIDDTDIPLVDLPTGRALVYTYTDGTYDRIEGTYQFNRPLR